MLAFYDKVVGLLDTGIIVLDAQGRISSWNTWMENLSGKRAEDVEAKVLLDIFPELRDTRISRGIKKALSYNCPSVLSAKLLDASFPLYRHKIIGSALPEKIVQSILIKPFKVDGDQQFCVISIYDISSANKREKALRTQSLTLTDLVGRLEEKGLELRISIKELEQVKKRLEQQNEELAQFAYRTSHDLKSPITTCKRLISYAIEDIKNKNFSEAEENSRKIQSLMLNLENLVTDITSLVSADLKHEDRKAVNIHCLLAEIKERLGMLAQEYGCEIRAGVSGPDSVLIEKGRLVQIVENLVSNGIKYRAPNRDNSFVAVNFLSSASKLVIAVEDNGVGIPLENRAKIFQAFERFHPKLASGSGLGMSIVKKHIDYLSGKIELNSSSEGTKFTIVIPI